MKLNCIMKIYLLGFISCRRKFRYGIKYYYRFRELLPVYFLKFSFGRLEGITYKRNAAIACA